MLAPRSCPAQVQSAAPSGVPSDSTVVDLPSVPTYSAPVHPNVKLRVDSASALIGSPNRFVVTGPIGLGSVDFTALKAQEKVVVLGEPRDSIVGSLRQWVLPFSVYDSVGLTVPGLPITVDGQSFRTNDVAFVVTFPELDTAVVSYRPIYREAAQLSDYTTWIAAGIGILVLATLAWFYYRGRVPAQVLAQAPAPIPPDQVALARLQRLRERSTESDEWFYTELDHTLRSYLEARFGIPALERTSQEVIDLLSQERLPAQNLRPLLERLDVVKFAKASEEQKIRTEHLFEVESFVKRTALRTPAREDLTGQNPLA